MDWTSVFDETGEEDAIIPHLMEENSTRPRLSRLVDKVFPDDDVSVIRDHRLVELSTIHYCPNQKSFTLRALYFLSINYILGVGCLGVPYAFARAGFILCSCILLVVSFMSFLTVMWVAETGDRYERVLEKQEQATTESSQLLSTPDAMCVEFRYEVIDLVNHYLGPTHKLIYQFSLVFLMFVGLLAYTQVFCGSITALFWEHGNAPPGMSQIIFGAMVIPLSCMELDDQVSIQSLMAAARFLAIFVMVAGSIMALLVDNSPERTVSNHAPYWATPDHDGCNMSYLACYSGFGVAFSTALFSQLFQHSVPGLLRPLKGRNQLINKVPKVFSFSLATTCSLYLILGSTAASYFGVNTHSSVNVNFAAKDFYFGFNEETTQGWLLRFLRFMAGIVVIFPALDTISVFPLIANTLGSNLYAASGPSFLKCLSRKLAEFPWGGFTHSQNYSDLSREDRACLLRRASKLSSILWRLFAAVPPLVASMWASDLSFSLLLSAVAGLYVAFFAPAMLQLFSLENHFEKQVSQTGTPRKNLHTR
eukprot:CAMPEP_0178899140 /NCGR_PEP_ID=MMETSP0786-20121207/2727_1 /TAXON_ID=186022 /ORGANISM="Thalassionema frauenfeldii, Strain CCMP 1798" /LENGTH=534 /DNA_ID=CAMNT_0020569949 /DNA_START=162 /DNA_END=1767 /DNA_ORIENTATION=+